MQTDCTYFRQIRPSGHSNLDHPGLGIFQEEGTQPLLTHLCSLVFQLLHFFLSFFQMESPVSTPAVLPLHLLVPVVNSDISSPCEQIMVRTRSVGVNTCDVALATEPECLGPCEPGTSVNLEGIVWQETEDGRFPQ